MRESDINRQLFHTGHYNVIAKQFRQQFEAWDGGNEIAALPAWTALTNLMLSMAVRFQADNELFDPVRFLTACSPDPAKYPFAELWDTFLAGMDARAQGDGDA